MFSANIMILQTSLNCANGNKSLTNRGHSRPTVECSECKIVNYRKLIHYRTLGDDKCNTTYSVTVSITKFYADIAKDFAVKV